MLSEDRKRMLIHDLASAVEALGHARDAYAEAEGRPRVARLAADDAEEARVKALALVKQLEADVLYRAGNDRTPLSRLF